MNHQMYCGGNVCYPVYQQHGTSMLSCTSCSVMAEAIERQPQQWHQSSGTSPVAIMVF
jgi:hypothetical protein